MIPQWSTATTELAPGVFAYVQATGGLCIANAGIIDGGDGAATVVDALFTPAMARSLLDETRRVAPGRIERLLNTHHHVDHTLGNAEFPPETQVIAHARARAEMERSGLSALGIIERIAPHFAGTLDDAAERLPDVTFDGDALEVRAGDRVLRLRHFGTGHTRGDVVVHLAEERILFAGDLAFFFVTPMAHEGHIGNWLHVVDQMLAMPDVDTIVPGHGPVGTKDDLRAFAGYLRLVHDGARRGFDAGATEAEARAAIDLGPYAEWGEPERLPINVARVYAELRGELDEWL